MEEDCLMPPLNGARVLVIENDPFVAAELDLMVEEAGGEVVALAGSHSDALTLLGREPVDAAIVGRDLPDGEGTSIGEELKRRGIPRCSIISASAYLLRTTFESRCQGSSCAGEQSTSQTAPLK